MRQCRGSDRSPYWGATDGEAGKRAVAGWGWGEWCTPSRVFAAPWCGCMCVCGWVWVGGWVWMGGCAYVRLGPCAWLCANLCVTAVYLFAARMRTQVSMKYSRSLAYHHSAQAVVGTMSLGCGESSGGWCPVPARRGRGSRGGAQRSNALLVRSRCRAGYPTPTVAPPFCPSCRCMRDARSVPWAVVRAHGREVGGPVVRVLGHRVLPAVGCHGPHPRRHGVQLRRQAQRQRPCFGAWRRAGLRGGGE
jgi:hypothetical protein